MESEAYRQISDYYLNQMISQGNTAEIYQLEDNKILKLFRESMPLQAIQNEYRIAKIVQSKLEHVPKAYDIVMSKQRYGIVYEQIHGVDLLQLLLKKLFRFKYYSRYLAAIHSSVHREEVDIHYSVKEKLSSDINAARELSENEKAKILQYLNQLPDGNSICHFDFHPGNIMIQEDTPMIIDWMTACTGNPCADVARTSLLLKFGEIQHVGFLTQAVIHMFEQSIGRTYRKEYQRITGISNESIDQWMLPVAAARLSEWLAEHERGKLLSYVKQQFALLEKRTE